MTAAAHDPLALIVIEDSVDDYELMLRRLSAAHPEVFAMRVESAASLVAALAQQDWSAVLSDHRLPGFGSQDALAIVRAHSHELPFIIVSGAIGEDAVVEAMRAGADDFVMKDRLNRLELVLRRALQTAAARRRQRETESAYQESEARLRAVAANLPGMMFRIEIRDGRVTFDYVSDGARRLFGIGADAISGDATAFFGCFAVADATRLLTALHHAVDGDGFLTWTAAISAPDAVEWVQIEASSRKLGPTHVVWDGLVIDISAAKRAERDLRQSREELQQLARHLAEVREEERDVVARELHDDVGSMLTGVKFETVWLKGLMRDAPAASDSLKQLDELVEGAILACNRIMQDLHPAILEQGIVAALEWQAQVFGKRIGVACRFHPPATDVALDTGASMAVFRICQESLNNVAKHACARHVDVTLAIAQGQLTLSIADDGIGLSDNAMHRNGHFGLRGMRERAMALGGKLAIGSGKSGTTITLSLPLLQTARADADAGRGEASTLVRNA
ncbi:MAG: ATP-binding protein [Betaproteobacteria bacterium]